MSFKASAVGRYIGVKRQGLNESRGGIFYDTARVIVASSCVRPD
jgi:hypothetical protein